MNIEINVDEVCLNFGKKLSSIQTALVDSNVKGIIELNNEFGRLTVKADNLRNANKAIKIIKPFVKKDLI